MKKILITIFSFLVIFISQVDNVLAVKLINPLGGTPTNPVGEVDPRVIIGKWIASLMGVLGTVALLLFMYGGVKMMVSFGDSDKYKEGRDILVWAAVGIAVIFSSYNLAKFAIDLVSK